MVSSCLDRLTVADTSLVAYHHRQQSRALHPSRAGTQSVFRVRPLNAGPDSVLHLATEEFDELCFQFGIELDEDTTEQVEAAKKSGKKLEEGETEAQLKIEIPANRCVSLRDEGRLVAFCRRGVIKRE